MDITAIDTASTRIREMTKHNGAPDATGDGFIAGSGRKKIQGRPGRNTKNPEDSQGETSMFSHEI
jgi:hypothetical protein